LDKIKYAFKSYIKEVIVLLVGFWATVCKTVCCMLSVHCLSFVLSVCDIGVLWPNRWMNQNQTWHGGRPPPVHHGLIVLDGDPPPLAQKGHSPQFWPMSVVAKRLDGSSCHLIGR